MPKISVNHYGYFYDFRHISVGELASYPDGLKDIQNRKLDGLIIRNVLQQHEIEKLLLHIERQKDEGTQVRTGYTFPRAFAEAEKNVTVQNPFENNFREWEKWRNKFPEVFGIDIEKRLLDIFSRIAGNRTVEILEGPQGIGCYIPCTIRVYHPNLGGIVVHCGNMFEELNPNLYSDLISKVITKNQMSYFIMLQTPQRGGELTIYDLEWYPGQMGISESEIRLADGRVLDTDKEGSIDKFFLKIVPGDMLVFAAGEIWHRVENIRGNSDRITLGGFLGFTKDDAKLTFWS